MEFFHRFSRRILLAYSRFGLVYGNTGCLSFKVRKEHYFTAFADFTWSLLTEFCGRRTIPSS